ncbi:MAG: hypothetical protein J2P36_26055, partial [Ktedonobacteraceae bacterium]|nr:hypothetical protein [Ktedonobacteraceae bacterium]
ETGYDHHPWTLSTSPGIDGVLDTMAKGEAGGAESGMPPFSVPCVGSSILHLDATTTLCPS